MSPFTRRQLLRSTAIGIGGASVSGWFPALAHGIVDHPHRRRHCILLWMTGGPSQIDTFDMKPNHENGGPFKEIATNVPGVRLSEHLPQLARHADKLAIVRGLSTKEGDHGRGTHLMRTGKKPMGVIQWPSIGALLSKEIHTAEIALPGYVSIAPYRAFNRQAFGPGYLGPKYAPLVVGATDVQGAATNPSTDDGYAALRVESIKPPPGVAAEQMNQRLELWQFLQQEFLHSHHGLAPRAHHTVYQSAVHLMRSDESTAFDLDGEPSAIREAYGRGTFGQGCLMARRLVERGVAFVEVTLGVTAGGNLGWDTHSNNFDAVKALSAELDAGWATLMTELAERGLLESTTIVWMGEFGRTPKINERAGRDHFPQAWTCVLAGGGIAGGQVHGRTSEDGMEVDDGQVGVESVLATLCSALGVAPDTENISNTGRPVPIVDDSPIRELLA